MNRKVVAAVEENGYIHKGWREADPVDDRTGRGNHHHLLHKKVVVDGASDYINHREISDQLHSNRQAQTTVMARTDIAVGGKIAGAGDSLPGRPGMADNMTYREEREREREREQISQSISSSQEISRVKR